MSSDRCSRRASPAKRIPRPAAILKNHILYRWIAPRRVKPLRPRALCLYVTYRCNMRCRTCGIWKGNLEARRSDMSLAEIARLLSDPLFDRIEFVNLNGGEPVLRTDLADIAASVLGRFPKLHTLTLNTNGFLPARVETAAARIADLCAARKVKFSVAVSLHRPDERFDRIAGVANAFAKVTETLRRLRALRAERPFYLSVNCVASNLNLDALEAMVEWGAREDIPVNFTLAEMRARFDNLDAAEDIFPRGEDRLRAARFFRGLSGRRKQYFQHALRYAEVADILERDGKRTLACHYAIGGAIVGSDGEIYYCKNSPSIGNARTRSAAEIYFDPRNVEFRSTGLFRDTCPVCPPNTMIKMEAEKDLWKLVGFWLRRRSGRGG